MTHTPSQAPTDDVRARAISEAIQLRQRDSFTEYNRGFNAGLEAAKIAALQADAALSAQLPPPIMGEGLVKLRHRLRNILYTGMPQEVDANVCRQAADLIASALATPSLPEGWVLPDELRELSEEATRGPWRAHLADYPNKPTIRLDWRNESGGVFTEVATVNAGLTEAKHNAAFMVAAVNFVRAMLAAAPASAPPTGDGE